MLQQELTLPAVPLTGAGDQRGVQDTLVLGSLFGGWYLANIAFNM